MRKAISKILLFTTLFAFIFTAFSHFSIGVVTSFSSAKDSSSVGEEKIYCTATLKDEFEDDIIMVVLTKTATFEFKPYTEKDFPELDKIEIEEVTKETNELVKKQLELEKVGKLDELDKDQMRFDTETYRRILQITLKEKSKENVLNAIKLLEKREDIVSASPSFPISACYTNPTEYFSLTNNQKWGIDKIGAPYAWDISIGSPTVTVAVIDSGIDFSHPDLANRESSTIQSVDYVSGAYDSHGTHVAGIIGAEANNGGIAGVAWDVRLVSLRVLDENGNGNTNRLTNAIMYASANNIPIINASVGGYGYNDSVKQAIVNYPGLFVAGAGNDNNNNDSTTKFYPASHRLPNLISVGATDINDKRANWGFWGLGNDQSNYGATTVDVYAPGTDIYSTLPVNKHGYKGGTSMAAPYVAGVAALMLSQRPGMGARSVKELLQWSAVTITISTPAGNQSVKRLDAAAALDAISDGVTTITTASEFNDIRNNPWGHYELGNDIDLSSYSSWVPIPVLHCEGILDGAGYKITGLQIPELRNLVGNSTANIGLFRRNNGTIMNLFIENAFFDSHHADHREVWSHVGFVVGFNDPRATIKNVHVSGQMNLHRSYSTMGGIAGKNQGLIEGCHFSSALVGSHASIMFGNGDMGGIAGENSNGGVVVNSISYNVDINHYLTSTARSIGGIVGYNYEATIIDCSIFYVNIANAGQDYTNTVPSMGLVVGEAWYSNVWYVDVFNNSALIAGTLSGHQLNHFGSAHNQRLGMEYALNWK